MLEGQRYASIELTTYQRVDSEASQTVTTKQSMRYSGGPITACKASPTRQGRQSLQCFPHEESRVNPAVTASDIFQA